MYNDIDFYEAASYIAEQVVTISDPQLAIIVEKWLTKLTSANSGSNELNYLKLLRIMVANKQICRPFLNAPPGGPLTSLSRYINPSLCDDRCSEQSKNRIDESWRTINYSQLSQTNLIDHGRNNKDVEFEDENVNGADDIRTNSDNDNSDRDKIRLSKNDQVSTTTDSDVSETDRPQENNDKKKKKKRKRKSKKDEDQTEDLWAKEDKIMHLAAGSEGLCDSYWSVDGGMSKEGNDGDRENVPESYCNPCVECLGHHLKQYRFKNTGGEDYWDLLEDDCALPALTETERISVSPELAWVLEDINNTTTLQEFYGQVSLYTCDQGVLLMKVAEELMDDYRAILSDVFESQTDHISDGLAKEQMALNGKYTYLEHRTLNRATVALDYLQEVLPMFDWYKYEEDPDAYMRRTILQQLAANSAGDDDVQEEVIIGDCGNGDGGKNGIVNVYNDDEDGIQHSVIKKMLYVLNSVRTEMTRVECENYRLRKERDEMTANIDESRRHWSVYRCQCSDNVNQFKVELTLLRIRSADLTETISRLTKCIQLAIQNKQSLQSIVC